MGVSYCYHVPELTFSIWKKGEQERTFLIVIVLQDAEMHSMPQSLHLHDLNQTKPESSFHITLFPPSFKNISDVWIYSLLLFLCHFLVLPSCCLIRTLLQVFGAPRALEHQTLWLTDQRDEKQSDIEKGMKNLWVSQFDVVLVFLQEYLFPEGHWKASLKYSC